jgi:hypothetical protein
MDHEPADAKPAGPASSAAGSEPASTATSGARARKRTKTGCLTCRKRRIKCGEERPTCVNCIKSKRHCDGYNQRIVFKPPNSWSDSLAGNAFSPTSIPAVQLVSQSAMAHALTLPSNSMPIAMLHPPFYGIPIDETGRPLVDPTVQQLAAFSPELNSSPGRFEVGSTPPSFDRSSSASFSPGLRPFASSTSVPSTFSAHDSPTVQNPRDQFDLPIRSPEIPSLSKGHHLSLPSRLSIPPDPPHALPNAWDEGSAGFLAQDGFVYTMQNLAATSNVPSHYAADRPPQPRGISRSFDGMALPCAPLAV